MRKISNSEVQTAKDCWRKWMLAYYHQLGYAEDAFPPVGAMWIGIIIHDALEGSYGYGENAIESVNTIYAWYKAKWAHDPQAVEVIQKDHDMAKIMVEGYFEWIAEDGLDALIEITGAEESVAVEIRKDWLLVGKLDLRGLQKINGFKFFLDHKTVGDLVKPVNELEINEQFPTYGLLDRLTKSKDEHCDGGFINMLRRVKRTTRANPPFYRREDVKFNVHQLNSMWQRINAVLDEIIDKRRRLDAGEDHRYVAYPTPSAECSWKCQFRKICPLMDDGSRWEDMVKSEYVKIDDPYSRYTDRPLRHVAREGLQSMATPGTVA